MPEYVIKPRYVNLDFINTDLLCQLCPERPFNPKFRFIGRGGVRDGSMSIVIN